MPAVLVKGQLSYLILSCLVEKDMYGLELIEEIKKRSGVEVKLPSLYSNINRMKELKYISSYLKESVKGPKCAYSSITELGRKELEKLNVVFGQQNFIDSFSMNSTPSEELVEEKEEVKEEPLTDNNHEEEPVLESEETSQTEETKVYDDYDDFFAEIPDENNEKAKKIEEVEEVIQEEQKPVEEPVLEEEGAPVESYVEEVNKETTEEDEEAIESVESEENESYEEEEVEEKEEAVAADSPALDEDLVEEVKEENKPKDDAVFLSNDYRLDEETRQYNQRVFDVSMDYNKNKKRKSFSENQIEMVVNNAIPAEERRERTMENVNSLKEALLQSRQGNYDEIDLKPQTKVEEKQEEVLEETKAQQDDGVFITDRVDYIPKTKRFEPPKLSILISNDEQILPAPKRNASIDPNCSDIKAKIESLYSLSEVKKQEPAQNETNEPEAKRDVQFDNYDDLKDYYDSQNISFKVYKRADKKAIHNTNKINFFVDLITFGVIGVGAGLIYMILALCGLTNPNTNFLYYLFPILYLLYVGIRLYMYKRVLSKVPRPLYNFIVVWGSALLLSGIVVCLNLAGGLLANEISKYLTTIIYPIFVIFAILIVRHYVMLFALKRYWR